MPCLASASMSRRPAVRDVVEVLHANDRRDRPRFGNLLRRDGADAEMFDQPFLLQLREHAERFGDGPGSALLKPPYAEIHHVEHVEAEILEIVVNGLTQLFRG